jgi:hypothetical protein
MKNPLRVLIGRPEDMNHSKDVDGRIILEWILKKIWWEGVDWMNLAQERDQWRALVNTVMNLRVP